MFMLPSMHSGGMERQISIILKKLKERNIDTHLVTFLPGGSFVAPLKEAGIKSTCLMFKNALDFSFLWRLFKLVMSEKPDVLCTHKPAANLLSVVIKKFFPEITIIWSVRSSFMELKKENWLMQKLYFLEKKLSKIPDAIIANTSASAKYHKEKGFDDSRMLVIPSGIDAQEFKPREERRDIMRTVWGVKNDDVIIGIAARLDPIKNHQLFFEAAAIFLEKNKKMADRIKFVCIGYCDLKNLMILEKHIEELGITENVIWTGHCESMDTAYSTLDIATSSTRDLGFPNAVAEAMACGIPCVALDIGDNSWIVGDTGITVEQDSPEALAEGWQELFFIGPEKRREMGLKARERIESQFSVDALTNRFLLAANKTTISTETGTTECVG